MTPSSNQTPQRPEKSPRVIGGLSGFAIVAGSMLGIGIFLMPAEVLGAAPDVGWFFALWILGGIIAWAGAVAFAELGAMMPEAGGDYVFQREALGPSVAFASGWVLFAAIFSGSLASMAVALFQYQAPVLLGIDSQVLTEPALFGMFSWAQMGGVALILGLTALNSTGTKQSATTQIILTLVPLILFGLISILIVLFEPLTIDSLMTQIFLEQQAAAAPASEGVTLTGVVAAYGFVYFAYSGWNSVVYVSGEVKDPGKTLPQVLMTGTGVVTVLYIIMCLAFLTVLGAEGVSALNSGVNGTYDAGSALGKLLGGETGTMLVTVLIALALIAGLNGTVLGGARVGYAMAKGGAFWQGAADLSPRSKVPLKALWLQAAWTCVIILSGRFDEIVNMTAVAMIITGSLTVLSLFALRIKEPRRERPYKATLYPWLPGLYLLMSAVVMVVKIAEAFGESDDAWYPLLGVGVLALAYATHRLWWRNRQHAVAVLAVFVIGGGLLIARGAGANQAKKPPEPPAKTSYDSLLKGAEAAASSDESKSVRLLYETLSCRSDSPPVEVARYAKYCKRFKKLHALYDQKTKSKATPWIAQRRPKDLPRTVLYPFSGADLVSSVLAFPDAILHVHMSLEHGGPIGNLEKLSPKDRYEGLQAVMDGTEGLLTLSDSKTKHLRLAHQSKLPGKLPIAMAALAAHNAEVVGIRYINVNDSGQVTYYKPGEMVGKRLKSGHFTRMDARWSNFELSFRLPGDKQLRVLQHMVVNLHNSHLRKNKGVMAWLKGLGKVSFMTKAATYLLWSKGFSEMASIAMDQAAWMITDASGILPSKLARNGWAAKPFGTFRCDLLKWHEKGGAWEKANDEMKAFFKANSAGKLDFRFGYVDCMNKPSIVIATRKN